MHHKLYCCTILHVIESEYGISSGHLETVHSYTNDQNLIDNMHKKARRGRSAYKHGNKLLVLEKLLPK